VRTPARCAALLDAIETGAAKPEWVAEDVSAALVNHADATIRTRAAKLLGGK